MLIRGTGLGGAINSWGSPRPPYNENIFYKVEKDTRPAPEIKEIKGIPLDEYLRYNTKLNIAGGGNESLILLGVVGLLIITILRR